MNKYLVVGLFTGLLFGISLSSVTGSNMIYTYGGAGTTNNYYYGGNVSMVGHNHTQDLNTTSVVTFSSIYGDGGNLTNITASGGFVYSDWFNQNLNSTDSFAGDIITANAFYGDGGNLTNITASGDGYAGDMGHPHLSSLNNSHPHNQDLNTTSAVTFATVDTGYGANELWDMDQHVKSTSNVIFADTTVDDLECDELDINPSTGRANLNLYPVSNQDACINFYANSDTQKWRWYLNENVPAIIYLEWDDGITTYEGLRSTVTGFPTFNIQWGFGGAGAAYGITQGTVNAVHDKGYAHTWIDASDPLIKEVFDIPVSKLRDFYNAVNIIAYYNKDHYWDENGDLIIGETDYSCFEVGCDALELKNSLEQIFGQKVVNSFIYERNMNEGSLMGISYRNLEMALIKALMLKVDNLESRIIALEEAVFG